MRDFAKLFDSKKYGQIVAIAQGGEANEPEIRFFVQPDGLGVCSIAIGFGGDDGAWDQCDAVFERIDLEFAETSVMQIFLALMGVEEQ